MYHYWSILPVHLRLIYKAASIPVVVNVLVCEKNKMLVRKYKKDFILKHRKGAVLLLSCFHLEANIYA